MIFFSFATELNKFISINGSISYFEIKNKGSALTPIISTTKPLDFLVEKMHFQNYFRI